LHLFKKTNSNNGLRDGVRLSMTRASRTIGPASFVEGVPFCHGKMPWIGWMTEAARWLRQRRHTKPVQPPRTLAAQTGVTVRSPSRVHVDGCFRPDGLLRKLSIARMTSHQEALVDFRDQTAFSRQ
jgi:hypothetical protein